MEEYEEMGNNAPDATNATTTTMMRHENKALFQSTRQLEDEVGKNHRSSRGVLKATSGNGAKRL